MALAELAEQLQGDNAAKTKVEMENILLVSARGPWRKAWAEAKAVGW